MTKGGSDFLYCNFRRALSTFLLYKLTSALEDLL